jgi:hypothetical protein
LENTLQEHFKRCYFLLEYNLIINLNVMPKLLMEKNFLSHTKGHHKDDEPQQSNIVV